MANVSDTTEGSGELDMNTWLRSNKLSSLLQNEKFMNNIREQEVSVSDLSDFSKAELSEFAEECGLRVLEKKRFINAVEKLQQTNENKEIIESPKSIRIKIVISEAEENAMNNIEKEEKKYDKYILNIKKSIENTKNNSNNGLNIIDKEFNKIIECVNKRKNILQKQLNDLKNKKLKIYNNNLNKANNTKKQLKNKQIEWDNLLCNKNINKADRKNKILTESKQILNESNNLFKNEIIHSINDTFNVQFNSTQNYKDIMNIGRIDGNEITPQLKVKNITGNNAKIEIEFKCDDNVLLYGLQYKQINNNNNNNMFMNNYENDEKKEDNIFEYIEFKNNEYTIKNLKYENKYCIRTKAKISENIWTNYSNVKIFETKKKITWKIDSKILTNSNEILIFENLLKTYLETILNKKNLSLKLIYRNSENGNSSKGFHSKCNGYKNTITLIHSNYNHIFGAFTTHKWIGSGSWQKADNTFLFLIRSSFNHQPRIYKLLKNDNSAVYENSTYGPTFGGGHDLVLQESGNNSTHYSYLGYGSRYEGHGNELCGGDTHKTNVARYIFQLKEYEVFAVN